MVDSEKICPMCGKIFISHDTKLWTYKIKDKKRKKIILYCSYTCFRKAGGGSGKFKLKV